LQVICWSNVKLAKQRINRFVTIQKFVYENVVYPACFAHDCCVTLALQITNTPNLVYKVQRANDFWELNKSSFSISSKKIIQLILFLFWYFYNIAKPEETNERGSCFENILPEKEHAKDSWVKWSKRFKTNSAHGMTSYTRITAYKYAFLIHTDIRNKKVTSEICLWTLRNCSDLLEI